MWRTQLYQVSSQEKPYTTVLKDSKTFLLQQYKLHWKTDIKQKKITFFWIWSVPRSKLKLFAGLFTFLNFQYLVSDSKLGKHGLFHDFLILGCLIADTKTLLEERRDLLDGSNSGRISTLIVSKQIGQVGHPMIACLCNVAGARVNTSKGSDNPKTRENICLCVYTDALDYF